MYHASMQLETAEDGVHQTKYAGNNQPMSFRNMHVVNKVHVTESCKGSDATILLKKNLQINVTFCGEVFYFCSIKTNQGSFSIKMQSIL